MTKSITILFSNIERTIKKKANNLPQFLMLHNHLTILPPFNIATMLPNTNKIKIGVKNLTISRCLTSLCILLDNATKSITTTTSHKYRTEVETEKLYVKKPIKIVKYKIKAHNTFL